MELPRPPRDERRHTSAAAPPAEGAGGPPRERLHTQPRTMGSRVPARDKRRSRAGKRYRSRKSPPARLSAASARRTSGPSSRSTAFSRMQGRPYGRGRACPETCKFSMQVATRCTPQICNARRAGQAATTGAGVKAPVAFVAICGADFAEADCALPSRSHARRSAAGAPRLPMSVGRRQLARHGRPVATGSGK